MYCHKCGKKVSIEDKFCEKCGEKLVNSEVKINSDKSSKKTSNLTVGIILSIAVIICLVIAFLEFSNKSENVSTSQTSDKNSTQGKSEKILDSTKDVHNEKEIFAKLLKSPKWLNENTDYEKDPGFIKFQILDINQDGISEMLLYHGESGGLAGLTLSIVSYNADEDKINAQKIPVDHGGYRGYLNNEKTIVVGGGHMGVSYMNGYKLEGDRYIKTFSLYDTAAEYTDESKAVYKLNDADTSKEKYKEFLDPINTNLTCTEMYSINDDNIKNVLGIDPNTIKVDSSIDRYSTLKFTTAEQAQEWLLKQDSNFLNKSNVDPVRESSDNDMIKLFSQHYYFEKDDYYLFEVPFKDGIGEPMRYLVGKHSGNVYLIGTQANQYAYLVKNNQVIEKLKYDNKASNDWRS